MKLQLKRTEFTPEGIFGELNLESGEVVASTLEHSYECLPKMPAGIYPLRRYFSPHFNYDLFRVYDVPGHDAIELHIGNLQQDSDGCVLLGLRKDGIAVRGSKLAFQAFMKKMEGINEATLEVVDVPGNS